jgi:hypothetical protein
VAIAWEEVWVSGMDKKGRKVKREEPAKESWRKDSALESG